MYWKSLRKPDIETVAFEVMGHLKGAFALRYGEDDVGYGRDFNFGREQTNRLRRDINAVLKSHGPSSHPKLSEFLRTIGDELAALDRDFYEDTPAEASLGWSRQFEFMQTRLGPVADQIASAVYGERLEGIASSLKNGGIEAPSLVERVGIVMGAGLPDSPLNKPSATDVPAKPVYLSDFLRRPIGQQPNLEAVTLETIGHVKGAFDVLYDPQDDRKFGPKHMTGWQKRLENALDGDAQLAHAKVKTLLTETLKAVGELKAIAQGENGANFDDWRDAFEAARERLNPMADETLAAVFDGKLAQVATRLASGRTDRLDRNDRLALVLTADRPLPAMEARQPSLAR